MQSLPASQCKPPGARREIRRALAWRRHARTSHSTAITAPFDRDTSSSASPIRLRRNGISTLRVKSISDAQSRASSRTRCRPSGKLASSTSFQDTSVRMSNVRNTLTNSAASAVVVTGRPPRPVNAAKPGGVRGRYLEEPCMRPGAPCARPRAA